MYLLIFISSRDQNSNSVYETKHSYSFIFLDLKIRNTSYNVNN